MITMDDFTGTAINDTSWDASANMYRFMTYNPPNRPPIDRSGDAYTLFRSPWGIYGLILGNCSHKRYNIVWYDIQDMEFNTHDRVRRSTIRQAHWKIFQNRFTIDDATHFIKTM